MIRFDEQNHLYFNEKGFIVPSVTEIIGAVYGTGLEEAPSYFVKRAADKGTGIHKEIEKFINDKPLGGPVFLQTNRFVSYAGRHLNLEHAETEVILHAVTEYGEVCGTADLICENDLLDYKTSKTATKEQIKKWQMQLSIYKFMAEKMGKTINQLKVLHLTETDCEEIPLEYLGDEFVLQTMKLYKEGKTADKPQANTQLQTVSMAELDRFAGIVKRIKTLEEHIEPVRQAIKAEMEKRNILNLQIGDINISYIAPTKRKSFDSKAFKADYGDLYEQYQKESAVKSSIRINVN